MLLNLASWFSGQRKMGRQCSRSISLSASRLPWCYSISKILIPKAIINFGPKVSIFTISLTQKISVHSYAEGSEHHSADGTSTYPAPYEADAQLAYLSGLEAEDGGVVAVISEDSDLLVYGCSAVVFKMDRYGNGEERELDNVFNTVGCVQSFNGVSISKKKKEFAGSIKN